MNTTALSAKQKGMILSSDMHNAVQRWSNSFFHPSIPTNVIDKSAVTEIIDERANILVANFLYGERNGELKDIPYDDSEFANTISDLKVETLWLYGGSKSNPPTDFAETSCKVFQIETGKTKKCGNCRGEGVVTCYKCNGTGYYKENHNSTSKACSCDNGKRRCGDCKGYRYVHTVIEVRTKYKVENTRKLDYKGEIPERKLKKANGRSIFKESVDYPKDKMTKVLQGGINPQEYARLQSNVSELFHSLIGKQLTDYDGDIKLVHALVDDFLRTMPNACEKNRLLKHEILPVRIGFTVEDAPVKRVTYSYKDKPFVLWIYGKESKIYAKKRPFGFTGRLLISWIIQIIIVGLFVYWITGPHIQHAPDNQLPVEATTSNTTQPQADSNAKNLQAAEQGNPEAQTRLGLMYAKGDGVAKDPAEAVKWFTKAAEQGFARAQNNLGIMYDNGNGVAKNPILAFAWFTKAADQGNADAQNNLGTMYGEGDGIPKDPVEAVECFRKAAEQGQSLAQNNLALAYARGDGVAKDPAEAVKWFTKAAERGYVNAQNNLGVMYDDGNGVAKDDVEAFKWFTKAAEQGFSRAQNNLGALYESGLGVPKDNIQAAKWYILAIAQGNEEAVTKYANLAKVMTPEQIDQAQIASKQFVPQNANH